MKVIAVTGGIACGKTTLLLALKTRGALVIDADGIARQLTLPGGIALPAIKEAFGKGVFEPDGTLNRKALADVIFFDQRSRKRLNDILHPMIEDEMKRILDLYRKAGERLVFLDIPLLFEANMTHLCNEIWCAYLEPAEQISRLMARDYLSRESALLRIQSQMDVGEKARLSDKVIDTSGSIEDTSKKVLALYEAALKEVIKEN